MRNYTEGRDKLRVSLEQNVQKQQDSANFDLNNTYGQMNKVRINTTNETTIYKVYFLHMYFYASYQSNFKFFSMQPSMEWEGSKVER